MQRRKSVRYTLSLPVLFSWVDPEGKSWNEGGFSRDSSTDGLYGISATTPAIGATVELEVLLPFVWNVRAPAARLRAKGTVVRWGKFAESEGFAASAQLDLPSGVD